MLAMTLYKNQVKVFQTKITTVTRWIEENSIFISISNSLSKNKIGYNNKEFWDGRNTVG